MSPNQNPQRPLSCITLIQGQRKPEHLAQNGFGLPALQWSSQGFLGFLLGLGYEKCLEEDFVELVRRQDGWKCTFRYSVSK